MNDTTERDPRLVAIPDTHGHAKGEHKPYAEERPLPLTARMLFLWFYHACRRGSPRFLMVADHMNYLTFEDPAAVNLVRRALKLAGAGDLHGAAETANVEVGHAAVVSEGLRRGMRYSIGAEVDNDPRSRPDAQNIVDAMRPDAIIRSVHFVPITHPVHGENWNWPFDNPEFAELFDVVGTDALWESYVTILVDAIERLPGHIIGHFYVPAIFGHWPDDAKLSAYEDRVLDAAAARGMAIEFNTRFLYRDHPDEEKDKYMTANRRLLRKAKQRGVMIAVGSDAHSPRDQGNAFDIVLGVLDELEINELVFPLAGSLRRVALRVVREPEPEPPPPPPAPEPVAKPARAVVARAGAKRPKTAAASNGSTPHGAPTAPASAGANGAAASVRKKSLPKSAVAKVVDGAVTAIADAVNAVLVPPAASGDAAPKATTGKARAAAVKPAATPAPAKSAVAQPRAEAPATTAPAKPAPLKAAPAKAAPVKAAPVKAAPVKAAPAKPAPAKASTVKPLPAAKSRASSGKKTAAAAAAPSKKSTPVVHAKKSPAAKSAGKAVAPPKAGAKKSAGAKAAPKKSAPVRSAAKKAAPKKPAAKAAASAKRAPARKKPVAKKAAAKKSAPARGSAKKPVPSRARSASRSKPPAKKSAKKTPPKRR